MGFKKWVIKEYDRNLGKQLANECDVDPLVALIASARGYDTPADLEEFLSDELNFSDTYSMADIMHAADIVNLSIENGKKIAVYGDYDCDGVTATAMLYTYLKSRNANCIYYIPDRFQEGYGMNCNAVEYLHSLDVDLIITVDNGIACIEEIELANNLGMSVVVTDHHLPGANLPDAAAIVDPHRRDCPSEFKSICGAEVAFKLICVMEGKEPEELLPAFADILSVAVIADVMPLTYENRSIVKYGIKKLKSSPLTGLSALLNVAGVSLQNVSSERIAFSICPRINAAGRMGSATKAVELLCETNMLKALQLANEIDEFNASRQKIERDIFNQAIESIEENNLFNDRVIVVCGSNWHHGVVGIVASRIMERYGVPCIVLSSDGVVAHGSGRSFAGFSLFQAVQSCEDLLSKFGGHDLACGLTIEEKNIDLFRERINDYAYSMAYNPPLLQLDCKLNPRALSTDLSDSLKQLEPFGSQNHLPVFAIFGVTLQRITPLSNNKHLKLLFSKELSSFQAIIFGMSTDMFCFEIGDVLDIAVTLETNLYNDKKSLSMQIKGIRVSGTDDDKLFYELDNFKRFSKDISFDASAITPNREEIGKIYRSVTEKGVLPEKIVYSFINTLGYGKTNSSFAILEDLGLIYKKDGKYFKSPTTQKTNLANSCLYNKMLKECEK